MVNVMNTSNYCKIFCFIISILSFFAMCSCASRWDKVINDKFKDIDDTRAFIVGKRLGVAISASKDISVKKGCNFNFADIIAKLVHDKFISDGFQAETIMPVSSMAYITDEWDKTGRLPKPGSNRYFFSISLFNNNGNYKIRYDFRINDGNHTKDKVSKITEFTFNPDSYSDIETCYNDFDIFIQQFIDEAFKAMFNKVKKSDL